MADEYVTITTLTNYPGVSLSSTTATNEWVVEMVNQLIIEVIGIVDPIPATVTNIAHRVAARALGNPEGYESLTIQIDDYKETSRFRDTSNEGVGVYLTAGEKSELRAAVTDETVPRRPRGIGSISLKVPGYPRDYLSC